MHTHMHFRKEGTEQRRANKLNWGCSQKSCAHVSLRTKQKCVWLWLCVTMYTSVMNNERLIVTAFPQLPPSLLRQSKCSTNTSWLHIFNIALVERGASVQRLTLKNKVGQPQIAWGELCKADNGINWAAEREVSADDTFTQPSLCLSESTWRPRATTVLPCCCFHMSVPSDSATSQFPSCSTGQNKGVEKQTSNSDSAFFVVVAAIQISHGWKQTQSCNSRRGSSWDRWTSLLNRGGGADWDTVSLS